MTPPRSKIFIGAGDFKVVGQEFKKLFIDIGGLKPNESVLDVGCGIGRMAIPLTNYLTAQGSYEGFDIVEQGIAWCQRMVTPRFPGFHFQLADVYNSHYHPQGRYQAHEYRFPFEDNRFDFVFLTSVFTHMPVRETAHYLAEISRVLKPGGRCFATFFLLNEESRTLMVTEQSTYNFQYELEGRYIFNPLDPDLGTAFDESWVLTTLIQCGLSSPVSVYPGRWCGRKNATTFQDIVVAYKR
ncbi:class I SAM-dependent methyltransferase [Spirosoma agri]|uniref:Class I SAM-dependent methyltransferase n=1 Tax=Spirosoma agri TaxID=1987381 RepID=A0A6M0IKN2_9BACT|nr:class I SAM-dependent methyltransferase [Spirosoma agri]NEU68447.1 class I SAM-dependent methyltransferase [Spirosoma agri]